MHWGLPSAMDWLATLELVMSDVHQTVKAHRPDSQSRCDCAGLAAQDYQGPNPSQNPGEFSSKSHARAGRCDTIRSWLCANQTMTAWPCVCLACCHSPVANRLPRESGNWFPGTSLWERRSALLTEVSPTLEFFNQYIRPRFNFLTNFEPEHFGVRPPTKKKKINKKDRCTVTEEYDKSMQYKYQHKYMHAEFLAHYLMPKVFSCVVCVCVFILPVYLWLVPNHWLLSEASLKNLWDAEPLCLCLCTSLTRVCVFVRFKE